MKKPNQWTIITSSQSVSQSVSQLSHLLAGVVWWCGSRNDEGRAVNNSQYNNVIYIINYCSYQLLVIVITLIRKKTTHLKAS